MDKQYIKTILEALKSSSSSRIQEALIKIKSKIIKNEKGIQLFRDCGGLEYLVPHLRKPNERILDISLSILGNICLEEESSLIVGNLNIFGSIVTILKTVSRDSIVGRACRLIGNLAQRQINAESLHTHGVVTSLVTLIENRDKNTSYPTLSMAVRAIRQLWMVLDKREEMLSLNAVRTISILLTVECETAGIIKCANQDKIADQPKKSQEELITGILKCMGYFSTYSNSHCAEQIQGDGRGYQCLVALTRTYERLALKCLMNLCYLTPCRPLLGNAGFVECLVGILQKCSETSLWPDGAAKALSHLSEESVNRARLRHCGALRLIVMAARDNAHAMQALLQYVFDDVAFQILINEGLVGLLTEKLTSYLNTMEYEHNSKQIKSEDVEAGVVPNVNSCIMLKSPDCSVLKKRRRQKSKNKDLDHTDSDTDDSQSVGDLDENATNNDSWPSHSKCSKRPRKLSPEPLKETIHVQKIALKDWYTGVYWEPKSPELQTQQPRIMSPDRLDFPLSPYSDSNHSAFSSEYRGSGKRARWDWSPESGFGTGEGSSTSPNVEYPWSPSSSASPTSPFSVNDNSSDSEISGRYSPVCSEVDVEVEKDSTVNSDTNNIVVDVTHDLDELIVDDEEDCPLKEDDVTSELDMEEKSSSIGCVLILLFCVSAGACKTQDGLCEERNYKNSLELLTGKECINALLDYVERCRRPLGKAARILAKIFSNTLSLMTILKHRLVLRLHEMSVTSKHPPSKCIQCKQIIRLSAKYLSYISSLAESNHGMGEISFNLLRGCSYTKETLSLTLPYIVKTEYIIKKYFIDCSALNLLLQMMKESKECIHSCVIAVSLLAVKVDIMDPKSLENRYRVKMCIDPKYDPILDNLPQDNIVTFELDDLSTVKANKVFLCQNSDVFSAMLMGHFKESAEKCVKLKKVTKPGLEYLLTLLHCGTNNSKLEIEIFPIALDLQTNLEVLLLADRFLLDRLKELLSSAIIQFLLTPENADKIYIWSLSEGMGFLCVEAVAYLLAGVISDPSRIKSFQNILRLKYKDQFLEDIRTMIVRQLQK